MPVERLAAYGVFSPETLDAVARQSETLAGYTTYQELFQAVGVPEAPQLYTTKGGRGVPVVDVPARAANQRGVLVVHLPMNNSLDTNQLYHVAVIAYAFPRYRVIAFGNPSGPPHDYPSQKISLVQFCQIACATPRRVLVEPELEYLATHGVTAPVHVGYSYGAHKALLTATQDDAAQVILLDPVAHPRTPWHLVRDFRATFAPLDDYVKRTGLETYYQARRAAAQTVQYDKGLRRPINLAIGLMLAHLSLSKLLRQVLERPGRTVTLAWGSASELGDDARLTALVDSVQRLHGLRLEGDKHAFANDVHLYIAVLHEALLRRTA